MKRCAAPPTARSRLFLPIASLVSYIFSGRYNFFPGLGSCGWTPHWLAMELPSAPRFLGTSLTTPGGGPAHWDIGVGNLVMDASNPGAWQFNSLPVLTTPVLPEIATFYRDHDGSNMEYNNQVYQLAVSGLEVFLSQGGTVDSFGTGNIGAPENTLTVSWVGTINYIDVQIDGLAVPERGNSAAMLAAVSALMLFAAIGKRRPVSGVRDVL